MGLPKYLASATLCDTVKISDKNLSRITNQLLYQLSYADVYPGKPPRGAIPKIEQVYTTISAVLLKQISPTNTADKLPHRAIPSR